MKKKKTIYYVLTFVSALVLIVSSATFFIRSDIIGSALGLSDRLSGQPPSDGQMQEGGNFGRGPKAGGNLPDRSVMEQVMPILREAEGNLTDEVKKKLYDLGLTDEQIEWFSQMPNGHPDGQSPQQGGFAKRTLPDGMAGKSGILSIVRDTVLKGLPVIRIILIVVSTLTIAWSIYKVSQENKPHGGM